jgi:lysyl endopeptidase
MTLNKFARLSALSLAACFVGLAGSPVLAARMRVEAERQPAAPAPAVAAAKRANPARIPGLLLAAGPDAAQAPASTAALGKPLQIGVARAVDELKTAASMTQRMTWEGLAAGRTVGAISITSPGAAALRAGLRIGSLPHDALLRFYAPGAGEVFEVTATQVRETIGRNLYFDDDTSEARTFWSPIVEGATLVIELELPAGATVDDVRIASPIISHMVTSAATNFTAPKAAASCNIDAVCHQATWSAEMDAVARIIYTTQGASYVCSGTLVADRDSSTAIPYFLTANHCINTQTAASTLQSYWFYRSTACNSGKRGDYRTVFGGATLLYATETTDTSFVRLNAAPPAGAAYAGWLVGLTPPPGASVTGIHHPTGDLQKISFGSVDGYYSCLGSGTGAFTCGGASPAASAFYGIAWQSGVTESGSSGSAIFTDEGHYLLGQLYGGSGTCTAPGVDFYGRFDVAYNSALYQWLGGTPQSPSQPSNLSMPNFSDLWWNPAESGWGLSITQHDAMIFAAWYLYDDAGRPAWMVMPGGQWTSATTFTGDLYRASGPDPRAAFDPARVVRERVGVGSLSFDAPDRALWSYQVNGVAGSKQLQRQPFGVPDEAAVANYSDLWWNAAESGWGVSISQQYRTLFAVWYAYAPDARPTWYVMPGGRWVSGDTYSGTLYRTASAPGSIGAFDANAVGRSVVGSLTFKFTSTGSAIMSYTVDGASGTKTLSRQSF